MFMKLLEQTDDYTLLTGDGLLTAELLAEEADQMVQWISAEPSPRVLLVDVSTSSMKGLSAIRAFRDILDANQDKLLGVGLYGFQSAWGRHLFKLLIKMGSTPYEIRSPKDKADAMTWVETLKSSHAGA